MGNGTYSEAEGLIERLRTKGCRVRLLGDQIEVIGPLEPEEITEIRQRKPDLLRLLMSFGEHRTVTISGVRWLLCSYSDGKRSLHRLEDPPSEVAKGDLEEFLRLLIA